VLDYCRQVDKSPAHLSGSILLCAPGSALDGFELAIADGKYSYGSESSDAGVQADVDTLRRSNLREMLIVTANDWRIHNHDNHFVEPQGPFTGSITIKPEGCFGTWQDLKVRRDIIVKSRRVVGPVFD
jgi:hypothetical protein